MKKLLLLTLLLATTFASAQLRNDKLKDQHINMIGYHVEHTNMDVHVISIRYLNDTFSRHEFAEKKQAKAFKKNAKKLQVSAKTIVHYRLKTKTHI